MCQLVSSKPGPLGYRKFGALVVLLLAVLCWAPSVAAQAARVSVTINSVSNRACIDGFPIFCGKADMMVRVALRQSDGSLARCPDTMPIANFDNIGPLPSCSRTLVSTPATLVVTIFDVDERQLPNTVSIQSEIRLSNNGSGETLPWFRLNGTPQTINGSQANITLTATVTTVLPAFSTSTLTLSRTQIDPTLPGGDQTIASSAINTLETPSQTFPTGERVVFSVQAPTGAITILAEGVVPARGFNLDWNGRIDGRVAPPGVYQLRATLPATGQMISAPVTIATISNVFEVQRASLDPWNARAGPVSFTYRLSPGGRITRRVEGPSAAGSACSLEPQTVAVPDATIGPLNAGNDTITVPVTTPAGRFLPAGNYCVRFEANTISGNLIGRQAIEVNLTDPPPLRIVASLSPAVPWILPTTTAPNAMGTPVPVPASPVFVEVRAVDDQGNPRPTGRITVRAFPFLIIPIPSDVITTLTCTGVSVCRMPLGTATMTRATDVIFDATATDLSSMNSADPTPLTASTLPRASALVWAPDRAGPVNVPVIGSLARGFDNVSENRTLDVAFHIGTGLDLGNAAHASQVSDGISKILNVFFGGHPRVGATEITVDRGQSIAFWLTRDPAVVDTESANPDTPGAPLCRRSRMRSVPFAEFQAVLHAVDCRDNADANNTTFSATFDETLALTAWHEFHHAAYDLADEYAGGVQYPLSTLPNVMRNAAECAQLGAEPLLCAQIGNTGWWRAAPTPDVMGNSTRENLDDRRRAKMVHDICSTGGC